MKLTLLALFFSVVYVTADEMKSSEPDMEEVPTIPENFSEPATEDPTPPCPVDFLATYCPDVESLGVKSPEVVYCLIAHKAELWTKCPQVFLAMKKPIKEKRGRHGHRNFRPSRNGPLCKDDAEFLCADELLQDRGSQRRPGHVGHHGDDGDEHRRHRGHNNSGDGNHKRHRGRHDGEHGRQPPYKTLMCLTEELPNIKNPMCVMHLERTAPFLCNTDIHRLCPDVMDDVNEVGDCLEEHHDELSGECMRALDSVFRSINSGESIEDLELLGSGLVFEPEAEAMSGGRWHGHEMHAPFWCGVVATLALLLVCFTCRCCCRKRRERRHVENVSHIQAAQGQVGGAVAIQPATTLSTQFIAVPLQPAASAPTFV